MSEVVQTPDVSLSKVRTGLDVGPRHLFVGLVKATLSESLDPKRNEFFLFF